MLATSRMSLAERRNYYLKIRPHVIEYRNVCVTSNPPLYLYFDFVSIDKRQAKVGYLIRNDHLFVAGVMTGARCVWSRLLHGDKFGTSYNEDSSLWLRICGVSEAGTGYDSLGPFYAPRIP